MRVTFIGLSEKIGRSLVNNPILYSSLAEYLAWWIEDASQEYGFGVVTNSIENE